MVTFLIPSWVSLNSTKKKEVRRPTEASALVLVAVAKDIVVRTLSRVVSDDGMGAIKSLLLPSAQHIALRVQ
jgi:hypothetical protein